MTTSVYKLMNEQGLSQRGGRLISSLMTRGDIVYQLRLVDLHIKPINGKEYVKNSKARVFDIDQALEVLATPVKRRYTVSVHQANLDVALREDTFSELAQIVRNMIKKDEL